MEGLFVPPAPQKGPLGDNHPGREVEVAIRVFIAGQASPRTVGHSAFSPSLVSSAWDPMARPRWVVGERGGPALPITMATRPSPS